MNNITGKFRRMRNLEFAIERVGAACSKDEQSKALKELILTAQECITDIHMEDEPSMIYKRIEDIEYTVPKKFKNMMKKEEGFDIDKHLQEMPAFLRNVKGA